MKERLMFVGSLFLVICVFFICILIQRNTQVSPVGGINKQDSAKISKGEEISINVLIGKGDYLTEFCAYWDDNEEDKVKLEKGFFTAKGEIEVPKDTGIHKLIVKFGIIKKYTYYYEVTE